MAVERVLIDTGPLVALMHSRDQHHDVCVAQSRLVAQPALTCWPVVTEAAWLLRRHPKGLQRLLGAFDEGYLQLLEIPQTAMSELAAFLTKFRKSEVQIADAALVYLANEHGINTIFTLDRRDFGLFRNKRNQPFTLIPDI